MTDVAKSDAVELARLHRRRDGRRRLFLVLAAVAMVTNFAAVPDWLPNEFGYAATVLVLFVFVAYLDARLRILELLAGVNE